MIGRFAPRTGFEVLSVTQVACVAALALSSFRWAEPFRLRLSWKVAAAVLVTSLLATALAFTVQAWAQRHVSSTRAALIFALEPVVAYVTSWLMTGEVLAGRAAAGALLILGGVLAVELKPGVGGKHPSSQTGESN